ncbi:MAG: hypothetical protein KF851_10315 [Pirellulaceae bacterium]|nr:hypothetical protein [Pirellulaceae bacterium]
MNTAIENRIEPRRREEDRSPRLTPQTLTILLAIMCVVPTISIFTIYRLMPAVYENKLQAEVFAKDVPEASTYQLPYESRPPLAHKGKLVVTNTGEDTWTQYNIRINRMYGDAYQIYEHHEPINPGETKEFELSEFVSRSGARFDVRYNPLRNIEIYARLPSASRATFNHNFEKK